MAVTEHPVVIVGGSSGIGLATARVLLARGFRVTIAGRAFDRLNRAAALLKSDRLATVVADATDPASLQSLMERSQSLGHVVVTVGGDIARGPLATVEGAVARAAFDAKVWAQLNVLKAAAPMIEQGGSITLTSGAVGTRPQPGMGIAAAINGAIESAMRVAALELAPTRVNVVSPGLIDTPAYDAMPTEKREAFMNAVGKRLPAGRVGQSEDVAQTIAWLITAEFVTGSVVTVDGGYTIA